jgi:hypothetical protein
VTARLAELASIVGRRLADEQGQGATEYILVAMLTMIPLIVLFLPTLAALRIYLGAIYAFIGLPVP